MKTVNDKRKEQEKEALMDTMVGNSIFRTCEKCNKEYKLTFKQDNDNYFSLWGNCPHCNLREDIWIRISKNI